MIFILDESDLKEDHKIVSFYFYASWMPFHKKMTAMISKIEEKHKDVIFYAIDTDHFKGLCKRFDIKEIPTVLVKKENKEVKRVVGLVLTSAFKSIFRDICND
jgi:thioredoxin-like negative regulator of GroEL